MTFVPDMHNLCRDAVHNSTPDISPCDFISGFIPQLNLRLSLISRIYPSSH